MWRSVNSCRTFCESIVAYLVLVFCVGLAGIPATAVGQELNALREDQRKAAENHISDQALRAHIRFLSDDLLEGRGPGSRGDQIAQRYIATQLELMGYEAAAPEKGWYQSVPLVGLKTMLPPSITLKNGDANLTLKRVDDFMMTAGKQQKQTGFQDAELVFVGYGIQAPEYDWDDFKDVDVRGKVLLMMNNDPADDPKLFKGRTRLYYGRWDYKYQMAAKMGAAGALIIHTTESAGYPYQVVQTSWSGELFELRGQAGPRVEMQGWLTDAAARQVTEFSGFDLDKLRQAAESREFKPVPLKMTLSLALQADVRELDSANVLGMLPGSDPELSKEFVIFMAHHDHIGMAAARDARGDNIYNGAVDNASGVAALLTIARAIASLPQRPKRSILIAAVAAEEQGLLGSKYLAQHPPAHPGYLAALINMDGINILGPTKDVNVIGLGKSQMDEYVQAVATLQNRVVTPDAFPDRGYYYRSDQFSLAKIGVPAIYLHSGIHVIGKPDGWGKQQQEDWVLTKYHQPSDEYDDNWDLRGGVEDTRLLLYAGLLSADATEMPRWTPGDEFEAARKQAIAERENVDPAATELNAECLAQIDAVVAQGIEAGQMPGCVVAIGRTEGILLLKAFGHRQIEPAKVEMTTDTVFDLASLTKPLATATSVMLLAEMGNLKLEDPVSKHIPEFALNGKGEITVMQLLTHQGGLIADNGLSDYEDGPEQALKRIWALPLIAEPGTKFIYSDVGFIVLGELVKQIAGKDLHQFTQEQLFSPLGMKETGFLPPAELRLRAAPTEQRDGHWMQGEVHDPRAHALGGIAGHAGLFSTAGDLTRYAQMLLKQGRRGDRRVLLPETIDKMIAPYQFNNGIRGLGWDKRSAYSSNRGKTFSDKAFGHGGFTGTAFWIDPELDLYVIFLSNRLHPDGKGNVNPLAGRIGTIAADALK